MDRDVLVHNTTVDGCIGKAMSYLERRGSNVKSPPDESIVGRNPSAVCISLATVRNSFHCTCKQTISVHRQERKGTIVCPLLTAASRSWEGVRWDVSGFVRLFLILTKNRFLTENVR